MTRGQVYAGKAVILIEAIDKVNQVLTGVENRFKKMGNNLSAMGRTAFMGGFFSTLAQGTLINRFIQFDDQILTLRVKMGLLSRVTRQQEMEFQRLEKRIRSLGRTTSFTAQEVAEGAVRLAQAGFSGKEIENTLQAVLDLARGTSTTLANAATVLANAIRTYNLETEEANEITSMFVRATRQGTIEIDDLAESLKYASATAVTLGQSLPEVLAVFTLLSDKGMRGSISGTSFNTALGQIAKKKSDIEGAYGFQVPVNMDGSLNFAEFLKNMTKSTKAMQALEKVGDFQDIFNLRGARSVLPIANEKDIQRLLTLIDTISSARDEARLAAVVMDSGLGGAVRRAVSAVDDLIISLGKLQSGPLMSILNTVPILANAIEQLMTHYQGFTLALASTPVLLAGVGAGMLTLGFAVKQLGKGVGVVRGLGGAVGGLARKTMLGRGVAGVAGLAQSGGGALGRVGGMLGRYPTGAASTLPRTAMAPTAMSAGAYGKFQQMMGGKMATAAKGLAASQAETQAAAKSLASIKATNAVIARRNAIYAEQLAKGQSVLNMEKQLQQVTSSRVVWEQKLAKATKAKNVAAATNAGKHAGALKAQEAAIKSQIAKNTTGLMGPIYESKLNPLDESAAKDRLRNAAKAQGAARAKVTKLQGISSGAQLAPRAKGAALLPQIMSGIGKAGGIIKNLGTMAGAFAKVSMAVGRFVFSLNGLMLLFTFGDRIPVVKDVLANLGNAFSASFGQLMGIFQALRQPFAYFLDSLSLLSSQETSAIGFQGLVDSLGLMAQVIQGKLLMAWGAFKKELAWVWDTAKFLVGTMWELLSVVIEIATNSIGNLIGNSADTIFGAFSQIFDLFSGGGSAESVLKNIVGGIATIVAQLFDWVGYAVIRLNSMFFNFIEELQLRLLQVIDQIPGIKTYGAEAEVTRRRTARRLREEEDLQGNEAAMSKFKQALDTLFQSDAVQEGGAQMAAGLQRGKKAIEEAFRNRQMMNYAAQQQMAMQMASPASMGGGGGSPLAPQQAQLQEVRQALRGIAKALVGSAAGTRGNTIRAVTEDELKKQTKVLEEIKGEIELSNTRSGNVFRK